MPLGQPAHAQVNRRISDLLERVGVAIVAHRGTATGSIAQNTVGSTRAALASGADIVEIDITGSTDATYVAFHDGLEEEFLGIDTNLSLLSREQIDQLSHRWLDRPGRPSRLDDALELLGAHRGAAVVFNVDRSWPWWPHFLDAAAALDMTDQLLVKSPLAHAPVLAAHPEPFPYVPICRAPADVEQALELPGLNTVGVELIARDASSPFADRGYLELLRDRGVFVFVNAETLNTGDPLFCGYDDETAVLDSPDAGWGPLFDLGVDAIQTDWPWLLAAYRARRIARG